MCESSVNTPNKGEETTGEKLNQKSLEITLKKEDSETSTTISSISPTLSQGSQNFAAGEVPVTPIGSLAKTMESMKAKRKPSLTEQTAVLKTEPKEEKLFKLDPATEDVAATLASNMSPVTQNPNSHGKVVGVPVQFTVPPGYQLVPCYTSVQAPNGGQNVEPPQAGFFYDVQQGRFFAVPQPQFQHPGNMQPYMAAYPMHPGQMQYMNGSMGPVIPGIKREAPGGMFSPSKPRPKKRRNRICEVEGCIKNARGRTPFCVKHGGGARCQVEGCEKGARPHSLYCSAHGGGLRCLYAGCTKGALAKSVYCRRHGKFTNTVPLM